MILSNTQFLSSLSNAPEYQVRICPNILVPFVKRSCTCTSSKKRIYVQDIANTPTLRGVKKWSCAVDSGVSTVHILPGINRTLLSTHLPFTNFLISSNRDTQTSCNSAYAFPSSIFPREASMLKPRTLPSLIGCTDRRYPINRSAGLSNSSLNHIKSEPANLPGLVFSLI